MSKIIFRFSFLLVFIFLLNLTNMHPTHAMIRGDEVENLGQRIVKEAKSDPCYEPKNYGKNTKKRRQPRTQPNPNPNPNPYVPPQQPNNAAKTTQGNFLNEKKNTVKTKEELEEEARKEKQKGLDELHEWLKGPPKTKEELEKEVKEEEEEKKRKRKELEEWIENKEHPPSHESYYTNNPNNPFNPFNSFNYYNPSPKVAEGLLFSKNNEDLRRLSNNIIIGNIVIHPSVIENKKYLVEQNGYHYSNVKTNLKNGLDNELAEKLNMIEKAINVQVNLFSLSVIESIERNALTLLNDTYPLNNARGAFLCMHLARYHKVQGNLDRVIECLEKASAHDPEALKQLELLRVLKEMEDQKSFDLQNQGWALEKKNEKEKGDAFAGGFIIGGGVVILTGLTIMFVKWCFGGQVSSPGNQ